jgi:Leucine-rich repeat (LRR) protein
VLSRLPTLHVLDIAGDSIAQLPPSIGKLKSLRYLELSHNQISVLPEEFVQLRNLEVLSINGDSQFDLRRNIPLLSQLPKLRELHLEGDNFRTFHQELKT